MLDAHNNGSCDYTSPHRPWRIETAIAYTDQQPARALERYLKSPSGSAFARKRR